VLADGSTNDTAAIQAAITAVNAAGGGKLLFPAGTMMASRIQWLSNVYGEGAGMDVTRLKQIVGTNNDFVWSDGDIHRFGIIDLEIDGSYFTSAWNASPGVLGNTSGDGLKLKATSCIIDICLMNIAGVGAYFQEPDVGEISANSDYISTVSLIGKDFGKEALIIQGPNDWILQKAWLGRAGILPRPSADTTISMSAVYASDPVDGIVIDGANIEIGDVHVYANWSGTGFRTRGTCRLTKGGRIISESNRAQVVISADTYGSAFFDVRRLGLVHPNWSAAIPTYSQPDENFDAVTIHASREFSAEVTMLRTITGIIRVVGVTGLVVTGGATVDYNCSNSGAPVGDADAGGDYTGTAALVTGDGVKLTANMHRTNGDSLVLEGQGCRVDFVASSGRGGSALKRDSVSNSKRGNNVTGSIIDCSTGFNSIGTPTSERLDIAMELSTGQTRFTGDVLDLARGGIWDISASVNNVGFSTCKFLSASLIATDTTARTLTIAHNFLYTPDYKQVQITLDDRATPSATPLAYLVVNNIDATNITIAYKYASTPDAATNHRVNVRVG